LDHAAGRRERHDLIDEGIAVWTRQHSDREAMEHLQANGIAAGMMTYISDQPTDPHLQARGYIRHVDQPDVGPLLMEGPAFHGTELADPIIEATPRLGADTPRICVDLLGLTPAEVNRLLAAGALHAPAV
jgi:crotonobetainyl-CoA:carnitine CoA-transferase CaiB-like acyl-CoA transferase